MRSKQNLRFKPHRIGVTAVETWISPVTEERLLPGNSNQRNTFYKNHGAR